MKLYYSPGTCALADHIVLEWIGRPFALQRVAREERKDPWFLALNPAGAVPVLEEDGWILTQNSAILHYLADRFPDAKLTGDGSLKERAEVDRWLAFVNADMHPAFKPFFGGSAYLEDEAVIEKTKANARESLRTLFGRIDRQLEGRDWVVGTRSIVDPYLFVTVRWAKAQGVDLSGFENIERFFLRMRADEGVRKAMREQGLD